MYILKNALKSITRTKWRNILIGVIIVVVATACCVSLSIKNSADKLIQSYKDSSDVEATLSLNRDSMRNNMKNSDNKNPQDFMSNIPELDVDLIKKYGDSEYIKSYYFTTQTYIGADGLTKVSMQKTSNGNTVFVESQVGRAIGDDKKIGDFNLTGYSGIDAMTDFTSGKYKITSGEMFNFDTANNSCVISNELAEENNLSVGDEITLKNPNNEAQTFKLKIVGIYEDTQQSGEFTMFSGSANKILTNYMTFENIVNSTNGNDEEKLDVTTNSVFKLKNQDVVNSFSNELQSKGLSSYYTVSTNIESLNKSIEPLQNISTFATTMFIIVLAIGAVVLVVINMINIRERKYEIGVLRAIGMKKHKVLLQFVIELFIVTFISVTLGTGIGAAISVPVSNTMLQSEISSMQEENSQVNQNFGKGGYGESMGMSLSINGKGDIRSAFGENTNYIDKLNAVIDVKTIIELMFIGILLTIISSAISMVFISRCSPLKILTNRT